MAIASFSQLRASTLVKTSISVVRIGLLPRCTRTMGTAPATSASTLANTNVAAILTAATASPFAPLQTKAL